MRETERPILWTMSDHAFPRHFRFMENFGAHTFRLVEPNDQSRLTKFDWKPWLALVRRSGIRRRISGATIATPNAEKYGAILPVAPPWNTNSAFRSTTKTK